MVNFTCGQDPMDLGIRTSDGWNITAFLDHLESCEKCCQCKDALIGRLNELIGGDQNVEKP